MKKSLISLAVAGAIMAPLAAQAEVEVYGKMHLSFGQVETKEGDGVGAGTMQTVEDNMQVNNHASRLGVKGSHDLGNGMSAFYKVEYEVNPDSDNKTQLYDSLGNKVQDSDGDDAKDSGTAGLKRRNQYMGLKGGFGEVRFGRHDTPLKMAQGKFDQFNDTHADMKGGLALHDGENRLDNVLAYINTFDKIGFAIALVPGEGDGKSKADGGSGKGDGISDTMSVSVSFSDGPIYAALAHDSYDDTDAGTGEGSNTLTRLVGTYKMDAMEFGLLYQTGLEGTGPSEAEATSIGLSFGMKTGGGKVKAQLITSENDAPQTTSVDSIALGYDHKLGKNTTAYVLYTTLDVETDDNVKDDQDFEGSFFGGGMVVKF